MGRITFAPIIYASDKRRDGTYSVRIRVTLNQQTRKVTTNLIAEADQLTKKLKIKDLALQDKVNDLIRKMRYAVADIDQFALDEMSVTDAIAIMEKKIKGENFHLDFMSFWVEAVKTKPKESRINYMCALHRLQEFMGRDSFDISELTLRRMYAFEDWLVEKYGKGARAVRMYTAAVKHIHSLARRKFNSEDIGEIPVKNPFEFYNPPQQKAPEHRDIDPAIIQQMITDRKQLKGVERRAVDAFLLSFALMGMNAVDMLRCKPPKNGILIYNRSKTTERRLDRAEMRVKIDERIMPLYYEWRDRGRDHAFKYHYIHKNYKQFNAALSRGLVKYRKRVNEPKLQFYCARHTWPTVAFSIGVDQAIVNDCLCHPLESLRMTNIYIHKDWKVYWQANEKVLATLDWSPLND